jgi:hypothetical protein
MLDLIHNSAESHPCGIINNYEFGRHKTLWIPPKPERPEPGNKKIQCCGSGMSIPDPGSESNNLSIFAQKNGFYALGNMIRVFHPGSGS